jgi:hypothetical protein
LPANSICAFQKGQQTLHHRDRSAAAAISANGTYFVDTPHIWEVLGSDHSQDNSYHGRFFGVFSQSLQTNSGIIFQSGHDCFLPSFQIFASSLLTNRPTI